MKLPIPIAVIDRDLYHYRYYILRNIAKLPFAPDGPQRRQDDTRSSGS